MGDKGPSRDEGNEELDESEDEVEEKEGEDIIGTHRFRGTGSNQLGGKKVFFISKDNCKSTLVDMVNLGSYAFTANNLQSVLE